MIKGFSVDRSDPSRTVFRKSRMVNFVLLAFQLVFFFFWYKILLINLAMSPGESGAGFWARISAQPWLLLFLVFPALTAPRLLRNLSVAAIGGDVVFDSAIQVISRSGRELALFADVQRVEIKVRPGQRGQKVYYLSILLKNGRSIGLDSSYSHDSITQAGLDLANTMKTELLELKGSWWPPRLA